MAITLVLFLISLVSYAQESTPKLDPNKFTVCAITINSDNEKKVFESEIAKNPSQFNPIVELTSFGQVDWFEKACASGVRCDQLLVSGHFAGKFFGDSQKDLTLETMEEMSCSKSCDGILKQPYEVFLMGCNTLAGKGKDHRTPEEYLQVLLSDHIPIGQARRIVEERYGENGESNRSRMQRTFSGANKQLYGFDSVGPNGSHVEKYLKGYFQKVNPAAHLKKLEAQRLIKKLNFTNQALAENLKTTAFVQCGVGDTDAENKEAGFHCALRDKSADLDMKVDLLTQALQSEDYLKYYLAINSFLNSTPISSMTEVQREKLKAVLANQKLREKVTTLANSSETLSLTQDWVELSSNLGFLSAEEKTAVYRGKVKKLFQKNLSIYDKDEICSLSEKVRSSLQLTPSDVKVVPLGSYDLDALGCLISGDESFVPLCMSYLKDSSPRISYSALKALGKTGTKDVQALSYVLDFFNSSRPSEMMVAETILKKSKSKDPVLHSKILQNFKSVDKHLVYETTSILWNLPVSEPLAQKELLSFFDDVGPKQQQMIIRYLFEFKELGPELQLRLARHAKVEVSESSQKSALSLLLKFQGSRLIDHSALLELSQSLSLSPRNTILNGLKLFQGQEPKDIEIQKNLSELLSFPGNLVPHQAALTLIKINPSDDQITSKLLANFAAQDPKEALECYETLKEVNGVQNNNRLLVILFKETGAAQLLEILESSSQGLDDETKKLLKATISGKPNDVKARLKKLLAKN